MLDYHGSKPLKWHIITLIIQNVKIWNAHGCNYLLRVLIGIFETILGGSSLLIVDFDESAHIIIFKLSKLLLLN